MSASDADALMSQEHGETLDQMETVMQTSASKNLPIDTANLTVIGENEKTIKALKENSKESSKEANSRKLDTYCVIISCVAKHGLQKGNLPPKISSDLKMQLINMKETEISDGMANKLIKNTAGAIRIFGINGDNITPTMVGDVFADADITSEAKLIKAVADEPNKTATQLLVDKLVGKRSTKKDADGNRVDGDKWIGGLGEKDQTEDVFLAIVDTFKNELENALRVRADMRQGSQTAGDITQSENEAVDAMINQLEGEAA